MGTIYDGMIRDKSIILCDLVQRIAGRTWAPGFTAAKSCRSAPPCAGASRIMLSGDGQSLVS
jgi:hypothetical protein